MVDSKQLKQQCQEQTTDEIIAELTQLGEVASVKWLMQLSRALAH